MGFNKIKSIYLVCSGYFIWLLVDTIFWMRFEPNKHNFILEFNLSLLIAGLLMCVLLVIIQWRIIKIYSSRPFLSVITFSAIALLFSIIRAIYFVLTYNYWLTGTFQFQTNNIMQATFQSLTLLLALMGLFYVAYYRNVSLQQKEQIAKTKALADEAQLLMLRYQINPHFLFNSLNAIQSMVEKDKFRAKEMIADLSDFFRYTLSKNNQMLVPLKEEIEAIQKYLAIQKERFTGRLKIDYEIEDSSLKIMLPFFIIHPLIENAIKYGFSADNDVLCLLVKVTMNEQTASILIRNTGTFARSEQIADKKLISTKTGIESIRKRLQLFYPNCSTFDLFEQNNFVHALITIIRLDMAI